MENSIANAKSFIEHLTNQFGKSWSYSPDELSQEFVKYANSVCAGELNPDLVLPILFKDLAQSTAHFTDEEFGAYMRLLIHQWSQQHIPDDLKRLSRIAESVEKNWGVLSDKFPVKTGNGLQNAKMEKVRKRFKEKSQAHQIEIQKPEPKPEQIQQQKTRTPHKLSTDADNTVGELNRNRKDKIAWHIIVGFDEVYNLEEYLMENFQAHYEMMQMKHGALFAQLHKEFKENNCQKYYKDRQEFRSHYTYYLLRRKQTITQPTYTKNGTEGKSSSPTSVILQRINAASE